MCDSERISDNEDKVMERLKKYEILYTAYADEIRNLWQRSIFLGAFMTLAWGGYGALLLKFIEKSVNLSQNATNGNGSGIKSSIVDLAIYHYASFGLCFVLIVLSLLWVAMAKGSKFVQEAHEKHIERHTKKYGCSLFCDLHKYERMLKPKLCKDLLCCGTLKPYRYSPSRINIALGWFSLLISFVLINFHLNAFGDKLKVFFDFIGIVSDKVSFGWYIFGASFGVSLLTTIIIALIISCSVKSTQSKSLCCKIWQWLKSLFSKPNDNQNQIKDDKKPRPIKIKIKSGIVNITPTKGAKNGI